MMSLKNELKNSSSSGSSNDDSSKKGEGLSSLNDVSGYDSDKLCPIDPLYYCILASFYSLQGNPYHTNPYPNPHYHYHYHYHYHLTTITIILALSLSS